MALSYATTLRNNRLDQITTYAGSSALLRIYDGTRPASGGTVTTLLAELTCNTTFASGAGGGVLTLNPITQDASADSNGTATWFRIVTSGGVFVMDGSVGVSSADLILTTTTIVATQPVSISSFSITEGNA